MKSTVIQIINPIPFSIMQTKFKLAIASILLAAPTLVAFSSKQHVRVQAEPTVYVCTGPTASTYHKTNRCSGLNRCSGDIIPVSLSKAKQMGRRPCKKCY